MGYERNWVALSSTATSTYTSVTYLLADAATIAVSVVTTAAVSSIVSIDGTNDDGWTKAVTNWSNLTALTGPGMYTLDPGVRWIRIRKASLDSATSVALQMWDN